MDELDEIIKRGASISNKRQYNGVVIQVGFHWRKWKILFVRTYQYEPWQIGPVSFGVFLEYENIITVEEPSSKHISEDANG